ncbi:MAG TPA: hypothetical protein VEB88_04130 [Candidatus Acidoferrales bacterium]|nr:hypothetical protein [Candidatus Acidoferrales bacterium]
MQCSVTYHLYKIGVYIIHKRGKMGDKRAIASNARSDGIFQFSEQCETLARGKISVYIDVWEATIALAFSKYDEEHRIVTKYVQAGDLADWGLSYGDLLDAVNTKGAINKSGWYPLTERIKQAVRGRDRQALALFNERRPLYT